MPEKAPFEILSQAIPSTFVSDAVNVTWLVTNVKINRRRHDVIFCVKTLVLVVQYSEIGNSVLHQFSKEVRNGDFVESSRRVANVSLDSHLKIVGSPDIDHHRRKADCRNRADRSVLSNLIRKRTVD